MSSGTETNFASAPAGAVAGAAAGGGEGVAFSIREPLAFFTWPRIAKIVVLGGLFFWLFHGTLVRLFLVWWHVPDWSHGLLIPAFSVGIFLFLYDRWRGVPLEPTWWGLAIIAGALVFNVLAVWWWQAIMFQDYSWWLLLVGMIVSLCGWRFTLRIWFPIFFILFAIRVGGVIYDPISTRLQQIAAWSSATVLRIGGIDADLEGVVITLFTRGGELTRLQVAEACSGMRILMAFAALGVLMAYMARRPWWHRWMLVAAIIPIAIVSNVLRVTGMGVLHYAERPEWASGFAHTLEGLAMLVPAFLLFWGLHALMCRLVVDEEDHGHEGGAVPAAERSAEKTPLPHPRPSVHSVGGVPGGALAAIRAGLRQPHFLVLSGVLLAAAASWQTVLRQTGAMFVKHPVPLQQMLDRFPRQVASADGGRWLALDGPGREELSRENELLEEDVERFLGAIHPYRLRGGAYPPTDPSDPPALLTAPQYIQRYYRHVDRTGTETDPNLRAYLFVSYYTGSPDPVPHVPDRCYLGGGFQEIASQDVAIPVNGQTVPIRRMAFGRGMDTTNVIYFFHFNGEKSSRHLAVRNHLNNPLVRHAYFAKIEVKFPVIRGDDLAAATVAAEKLLAEMLPVLEEQFLPDWEQYRQEEVELSGLWMALVPGGFGAAVVLVGAVVLVRRRGRPAPA